uniref:Phosphomevalonate kinase n=1 Tax=Meloidogyne hapla TaxID=6305 RepID=A0A1I8C1B3_MELHA
MSIKYSQIDEGKNFIFLCISGKRKSGKEYAKINNLNFNNLMSDGKEKELVRKEMIEFGEKLRKEDFGIFCR